MSWCVMMLGQLKFFMVHPVSIQFVFYLFATASTRSQLLDRTRCEWDHVNAACENDISCLMSSGGNLTTVSLPRTTFGKKCTTPIKRSPGVCSNEANCRYEMEHIHQQLKDALRNGYSVCQYLHLATAEPCGPSLAGYTMCCEPQQQQEARCGLRHMRESPSLRPSCDADFFSTRIQGGQDSPEEFWPWSVVLVRKTRKRGLRGVHCGGTLITTSHILTAAHCFDTFEINEAILGITSLSQIKDNRTYYEEVRINPRRDVVKHPDYTDSFNGNDIAIITLRVPSSWRDVDAIQPICLPDAAVVGVRTSDDSCYYVTGFGISNETLAEQTHSMVLRHAAVPLWEPFECQRIYQLEKNISIDTSKQLCAKGDGTDACRGDSGGGLGREIDGRWTVFGIVSFGPTCGSQDFIPTVYTRVEAYMDWISSIIKL